MSMNFSQPRLLLFISQPNSSFRFFAEVGNSHRRSAEGGLFSLPFYYQRPFYETLFSLKASAKIIAFFPILQIFLQLFLLFFFNNLFLTDYQWFM